MFYQNFRNTASAEIYSVNIERSTIWKRIQQTVYVPTDIVQIGVAVYSDSVGTTAANDYFEVTGLQLEIGQVATPFEHRSQAQELVLCQRYYWETGSANPIVRNLVPYSTSNSYTDTIFHPVPMRAVPTITVITAEYYNGTSWVATNGSPLRTNTLGFNFEPVASGAFTQWSPRLFQASFTASAEL
jgi:hypothetical protein